MRTIPVPERFKLSRNLLATVNAKSKDTITLFDNFDEKLTMISVLSK